MKVKENRRGEGDTFLITPTILLRVNVYEDRMDFVTTEPGTDREALIVFRNPEDAAKFQEDTGKFTEEEGFGRLTVTHKAIANILEMQNIPNVVMPQGWKGGTDEVDRFKGASFVRFLEASPPAIG